MILVPQPFLFVLSQNVLDSYGTVGHIIAPFSDSRKPQKPVIYTKSHSEEIAAIGHISCKEIAITAKTIVHVAYVTALWFFLMKLPFILCKKVAHKCVQNQSTGGTSRPQQLLMPREGLQVPYFSQVRINS